MPDRRAVLFHRSDGIERAMQTLSGDRTARQSPVADAAKAQARLDRIARPNGVFGRAPDGEPARGRDRSPGRARDGFRLGAWGWLLIQAALVALVLTGVLIWPPVDTCRDQERKSGFQTGDTLDKCIRRGIAARTDVADQWIKRTVRGSGN